MVINIAIPGACSVRATPRQQGSQRDEPRFWYEAGYNHRGFLALKAEREQIHLRQVESAQ
jgi:hypothetical protein